MPDQQLSRTDARRLALRGQLTAARPPDLGAVLRGLMVLQDDPTRHAAPSADLVLWSRLRSAWAQPVLHGDRLVGKVDAISDRREGELRVDAIHEDVPFGRVLSRAVHDELRDLAGWLDLELVVPA